MNMKIYKIAFAAAPVAVLAVAGGAHAATIVPGVYQLHNHPDGNAASPHYGLRLDELFNATSKHDIFTFDFDAEGANMKLEYDGDSIHIYGTAFGGLDTGSKYDPAFSSLVEIDFTYSSVHKAFKDDDLIVTTPDFSNTGTITWLETGETIDLFDFSGNKGYTFRFGDEHDDEGHRGFPGLSGWGWLDHHEPGTHIAASDWLFTGELIPLPPAVWLGAAGLAGVVLRRRRLASSR